MLRSPFRLCVPSGLYAQMLQQAQAEHPNECCGLLAGRVVDGVGRVERCYPLVNELESPTEYRSEPQSMFDAYRDLRNRGIDVLAVYHSHPASAPVPSRKDRERNYSEAVVNLIIGLSGPEPVVRGWWLTETDAREAAWEVSAD